MTTEKALPLSAVQMVIYKKFIKLPQVDLDYLANLAVDMKLDLATLGKFMANQGVSFDTLIKINEWMIKIQGKK